MLHQTSLCLLDLHQPLRAFPSAISQKAVLSLSRISAACVDSHTNAICDCLCPGVPALIGMVHGGPIACCAAG